MIDRAAGWLMVAAIVLSAVATLNAQLASDQAYAASTYRHAATFVECRNAYVAGSLIATGRQTTPDLIAAPPAHIATAWANHSSQIRAGHPAGHGIGPCSQPGAATEQALTGLLTQLGYTS